jgi:hypothetical protein
MYAVAVDHTAKMLNSSLSLVMFSSPLSLSPHTSSWSWLWTSGAGTFHLLPLLPILGSKVLYLNCFMTWGNRCLWWWCWYQGLPALVLHFSRSVQELVPSSLPFLPGYQYLLIYLPTTNLSGQWEGDLHKKETKTISMSTDWRWKWSNEAKVFCFLSSLPLTPPPPPIQYGSVWASLESLTGFKTSLWRFLGGDIIVCFLSLSAKACWNILSFEISCFHDHRLCLLPVISLLLANVGAGLPIFISTNISSFWEQEGGIFTLLVLEGMFCIAAATNIIYIYTAELYPTVIRYLQKKFTDQKRVLLHNGGSWNACTMKRCITLLCIPKQSTSQNGVVP